MKRPIAELLLMTLQAGAESDRTRYEHEAWQILRRKQGYVTHRIYERIDVPLERLVYAEWESVKAADGARQHVQGTPLARRARALLAGPSQRLILELVGPITSTKGLDLPSDAVAATAMSHLVPDTSTSWRALEDKLWKVLSNQLGHVTHVRFHGLEDPSLVGSLSHWTAESAFRDALVRAEAEVNRDLSAALARPMEYVLYRLARD